MEVKFVIILRDTLSGVTYGLQQGAGTKYQTIQRQDGGRGELRFECNAEMKTAADGSPNFLGVFCQGTPKERFLYIDIGSYSIIADSVSGGRLKIPLYGIDADIISALKSGSVLQTSVSAIGKKGRPAYGTVKPFEGWVLT